MIDYIQQIIDEEIPIAQKMNIRVQSCSPDAIVLKMPVRINKNHQNIAFGGSVYSGLVLAGWGLLTANLAGEGLQGQVVIQNGTVDYIKPISNDFEICATVDAQQFTRFLHRFRRKKVSRITVTSSILSDGMKMAEFSGRYVAYGSTLN